MYAEDRHFVNASVQRITSYGDLSFYSKFDEATPTNTDQRSQHIISYGGCSHPQPVVVHTRNNNCSPRLLYFLGGSGDRVNVYILTRLAGAVCL